MVAGLGLSTASMLGGCGVAQPEGVVRFNDAAALTMLPPDQASEPQELGWQEYRAYFADPRLTNRDMVELTIWAADQAINQDQELPRNFLHGLQSAIADRWQSQPGFLRQAVMNSAFTEFTRGSPADPADQPERYYSQLIFTAGILYFADHYLALVTSPPSIVAELNKHKDAKLEDQIASLQSSYNRDPVGFAAKFQRDIPGSLDEAHKTALIYAGMLAIAQSVNPQNYISATAQFADLHNVKLTDIILTEQPFSNEAGYKRITYRKGEEIWQKTVGLSKTYEFKLNQPVLEIEALTIDTNRRMHLASAIQTAAAGNVTRLRIDPVFLPRNKNENIAFTTNTNPQAKRGLDIATLLQRQFGLGPKH
jgi:hypothetical protein